MDYTEQLRAVCRLAAGSYFLASVERIALEDFQAPWPQRTAVIGGLLQVGEAATARLSSVSDPRDRDGTGVALVAADAFAKLNQSQFDGAVRCLLVLGTTLIVGGTFQNVTTPDGTLSRSLLCAFDLTTGDLTDWSPGVVGTSVDCLCLDDGGGFAVGGDFSAISEGPRAYFAAYDATFVPLATAKDFNGSLIGLHKVGGFYYAVGNFNAIGAFPHVYAAKFDDTASNYSWYSPAAQPRGFYYSADTSQFYIIGTNYAVSVLQDGSGGTWTGISIVGINVAVVASATRTIVGARVSTLEGSARNNWGATNAVGLLNAFAPTTDSVAGASSNQRGAVAFSGTDVLLAADFGTVNGTARPYVAAVDADGELLPWDAALAANGAGSHCNALASYAGKVIMGGQFTSPAGGLNLYAKDAP